MSFILLCLAVIFMCAPISAPPWRGWVAFLLALFALIFWCIGASRGNLVILA